MLSHYFLTFLVIFALSVSGLPVNKEEKNVEKKTYGEAPSKYLKDKEKNLKKSPNTGGRVNLEEDDVIGSTKNKRSPLDDDSEAFDQLLKRSDLYDITSIEQIPAEKELEFRERRSAQYFPNEYQTPEKTETTTPKAPEPTQEPEKKEDDSRSNYGSLISSLGLKATPSTGGASYGGRRKRSAQYSGPQGSQYEQRSQHEQDSQNDQASQYEQGSQDEKKSENEPQKEEQKASEYGSLISSLGLKDTPITGGASYGGRRKRSAQYSGPQGSQYEQRSQHEQDSQNDQASQYEQDSQDEKKPEIVPQKEEQKDSEYGSLIRSLGLKSTPREEGAGYTR